MRAARIGFAGFLFLLTAIGLVSGIGQIVHDSGDYDRGVRVLVGAVWILSGLLFAAAGALLLRRRAELSRRTTLILAAVCVADAVVLTVSPVFGAPLAAVAALGAVARFAP
jgi:cytochrome c biogenesis protein CcdA